MILAPIKRRQAEIAAAMLDSSTGVCGALNVWVEAQLLANLRKNCLKYW